MSLQCNYTGSYLPYIMEVGAYLVFGFKWVLSLQPELKQVPLHADADIWPAAACLTVN